jgi:hypothetical protein
MNIARFMLAKSPEESVRQKNSGKKISKRRAKKMAFQYACSTYEKKTRWLKFLLGLFLFYFWVFVAIFLFDIFYFYARRKRV